MVRAARKVGREAAVMHIEVALVSGRVVPNRAPPVNLVSPEGVLNDINAVGLLDNRRSGSEYLCLVAHHD